MSTQGDNPGLNVILFGYLGPIIDSVTIFNHGIGPTCKYMWNHPLSIFSLSTWRSQFIDATQPWLMNLVDQAKAPIKREILRGAQGVVLEIGAGTGETLKYYSPQVDRIYGVEPNLTKCAILVVQSERLGIKDKYHIIPRGIEDLGELELIDTIVCVYPSVKFYRLTLDSLPL